MLWKKPAESLRDMFRLFWPYTRGDRRRLLAAGILAIVVSGGEIGTVVIFDSITNKVLTRGQLAGFWPLAEAWLGVAVVTAAAMFVSGYHRSLASERFLLRLRDSLFARIPGRSPEAIGQQRVGDLMVRLIDDVEVIDEVVCAGLVEAAAAAVSMALFATAAFVMQWQLALMALALAPLFWLASRGFSGRLSQAAAAERAVSGSFASAVEENLAGQSLDGQPEQASLLHQEGTSLLRARMAEAVLDSLYAPLMYLVETVSVLAVFGFGAWQVATHRLGLGALLAFALLLAYVYPEAQDLSEYRAAVAAGRASARRVTEILESGPPVTNPAQHPPFGYDQATTLHQNDPMPLRMTSKGLPRLPSYRGHIALEENSDGRDTQEVRWGRPP
jgi:ATP-binding cassette, subfamily B, bacterial